MGAKRYKYEITDGDGRILLVCKNSALGFGYYVATRTLYGTTRRKACKGFRGNYATAADAQADLDAYAQKYHLAEAVSDEQAKPHQ